MLVTIDLFFMKSKGFSDQFTNIDKQGQFATKSTNRRISALVFGFVSGEHTTAEVAVRSATRRKGEERA